MITKDKMLRFFDEPNDGGGEGGSPGANAFEPEDGTTTTTVDEPEKPVASMVDAKQLAQEFGGQLREFAQTVTTAREEKKITPEEAKKLLRIWEPNEEFVKKFGNLETQLPALVEMRDGLLTQFDTLSQHRLREVMTEMEKKYAPALEALQQMQHEQRETRFNSVYPQLAKPTLKPLLQAVAQKMVDGGKKFDDEGAMFDAIAKEVETVIKETNPDFKLEKASGSSPAKDKTKTTNSIPVTTSGAGGGTGTRGGDKTANKPRGVAVFD
jgi:uncharacterized membrane protein YdfJ with MMPL/SSD domain